MTRCLRPLLRLLVLGAAFAPVAGASASTPVEGDQLEQVVLLSRHNLRAPLVESGALQQATPQSWAQWPVAAGELTTKGGVLEVYLGHYLRRTLAAEGMLPAQGCPAARDFHAYANSLQRTQATAQFFIAGAFPGCALMVEQRRPLGTMDPVFNPLIVRDDAGFRQRALRAMQQTEKRAALAPPLAVLDAISDYPRSPACAGRDDCRLSAGGTRFAVEPGREPSASGALALANGMVDAMLMEYYQGVPLAQIGWGRLRSPAQWQALAAVRNGYQDILFGTPEVAREVAAPLLAHLRALFADPQAARVTLLVGHDSNIGAVLAALGAADYQLPGQYERTPIGGLLRFERWHNRQSGEQRLRLFYVYPSAAQLRDVTVLDDEHPPGKVLLKLPACGMDHEGFCRWPRFTALLDPAG